MTTNIIRNINLAIFLLAAAGCASAQTPAATITIANPLPQPRTEMVEVASELLPASPFIITDSHGGEVPWQLTYDSKIIFPASVEPSGEATYTVVSGNPTTVDDRVYAAFYPERVDDIAWENDYAAYRAYGPAFGESGGKAFGYDVFTKSTTRPVVPERYFKEIIQKVSYHNDHGDGMDQYDVGPTLGGGASAAVGRDGEILFPGAFSEWKILDNGPLRTTLELVYPYAGGTETRLISLDAGTPFNHTVCRFEGFDCDSVAAGVAIHRPSEADYVLGPDYVAFNDPTTSPGGRGIGRIFVGVVNPTPGVTTSYHPFSEPKGTAVGHALTVVPYTEGEELDYYWGSSWNKGRIMSYDSWIATLSDLSRRLRAPLKISVTR